MLRRRSNFRGDHNDIFSLDEDENGKSKRVFRISDVIHFLGRSCRFLILGYLFLFVSSYLFDRKSDLISYNIGDYDYYIASNLHNSELIIPNMNTELKKLHRLLKSLGSNVYVSIYENGSTDKTKDLLLEMKSMMDDERIMYSLRAESISWKSFCSKVFDNTSSSGSELFLYESCMEADCRTQKDLLEQRPPPGDLNHCRVDLRIPIMAYLRELPIIPLREMIASGIHKGYQKPMIIVYVNDVFFTSNDILRLLSTNFGPSHYEFVCGLDFHRIKFYDRWVTRDLNGDFFSSWFPYVTEEAGLSSLVLNKPIRVYSCWNGIVATHASFFTEKHIKFRSWELNEGRSVATSANSGVFDVQCPVSECALISKDIWTYRHTKLSLPTRVYINPHVKVFYTRGTVLFQRFLIDPLNFIMKVSLRLYLFMMGILTNSQSRISMDTNACTKFDECLITPPATVKCGT
jgi:Cryptococcal mannosyltransferase 1